MRILGLDPSETPDQQQAMIMASPAPIVHKATAPRLHALPAHVKPGVWKNGPKRPVFTAPPLLTIRLPLGRRLSIPHVDFALLSMSGRQLTRLRRFVQSMSLPRLRLPLPRIHVMAPRIHIDLTPFTRFAIYGLGLALCGTAAAGASIAYDRVHEAREQANEMAQRAAVANARIASLEWESQHLSRSLHALEQQDNRLRAVLAQTIATATTTSGNAPAVSVAALPATTMSATDRETVDSNTIPSIDPTNGGEVTSTFGWRTTPWPEFHKGIDLAQPQGHPVMASAAGIVVTADPGWNGGFGNFIDIDHGNGFHTYYGHLSSIYVHAGAHVIRGMVIAAVGMTGEATGPHLHYQIMHNGVAIDPAPFLHGVPAWAVASSGTTKTKI